ncbi:FtsK/SpoIIIE domain-containing protein [Frigoribacterium sp. PvP032]|uniref:FtsK/SpoIIIE domain-containing protein n=1 Tax=Frigoribacterium sp. PvP032 TaxID=2806589 RepID=UPI001AE37D71|nr:FtsK/SpoIIIE domain-containing protein [Frigoribacterium sp. PvP032]MBP1191856.1 S-DNA-T family DNA segregation ATPase FtsK/SpoIIIE [Frigoribacterium sp. PvP032]
MTVDGRLVPPSARVAEGQVQEGSLLTVGAPPSASPLPDDTASVRIVGGRGAGTLFVVDAGASVIGSSPRATIRLADVPPFAAVLRLDGAGTFTIEPATASDRDRPGGRPVVAVDRRPLVEPVVLDESSVVRVGEVLLAVVTGRLPGAALHLSPDGVHLEFARPPRLLPESPARAFRLPAEPQAPSRRPLPIVAALAPLAMAGVMVGVFGHLTYLAFGLMSPVVLIANYVSDRKNGRVTHRRRLAEHEVAKASVVAAADEAVHRLEHELRASCPDAATLLDAALRRRARLWERRRSDPDHLTLRVGTADHPSGVTIEDPRELEHLRTVAREAHAVPVTLDLPGCGVVGIAGPDDHARPLAAWLVAQIGVLQSPRDVEVVLLTSASGADHWSWLRWLPHARPAGSASCSTRVGHDAEGVARRLAELTTLIETRRRAARDSRGPAPDVPDVVVVVDGARRLRALPGLVSVLADGPSVRVWSICLDVDERSLPEECVAVVSAGAHRHRVAAQRTASVQEVLADELPAGWHDAAARAVAPIVEVEHGGAAGGLPTTSRLLDVLDLDEPDGPSVLARWRRLGPSTRVLLGESIDGPFGVDLRADGPHALVAGTTGSGKSELLQSLVASLAATNAPDAMAFVLIDYKGGAAFRDFASLPHTVGMVTDLDGHLVERALTSLRAELHRREVVLSEAGAKDVEDHAELVARGEVAAALPRLLIVIDEFASMVRELPDFVTGLVDVAQRGRSLGIHLVLATQRPTGVVSADIRANTALRVALRVTDPAESTDVIDAPDASGISASTPGRAFVRLGAGALLPFQAGRVGGRAPGAAVAADGPIWSCRPSWATTGSAPQQPPEEARADSHEVTDLVQLVAAASAAHVLRGGPLPHRPWLDALPAIVLLDELSTPPSSGHSAAVSPLPFGLEDHPARQLRRPAVLDLDSTGHLFVVGSPRSGRSQALRALAASIADLTSCSDVHLYGIDCGSGALLPLTALPHTGAVVQRTEVDRARRLLSRLVQETLRRQDVLARQGHGDVVEQRRAAPHAARLPHLVVMIDRWEGFTASFGELDHGEPVEQVTFLLREGAGAGVHVVVTGDRQLITGRLGTLVQDKLVLRLSDRSDYGLAGLSPRALPDRVGDGRGFTADTAVETQVALLAVDAAASAQGDSLRIRGAAATERDRDVARDRRPFRLERLDGPVGFDEAWGRRSPELGPDAMLAMVGLGGDDMGVVGPDLAAGAGTFLVAGPGRSGRSTVLTTIARSLLAQGVELVVVAPRASPLRHLAAVPGVLALVTTATVHEDDLAPWFDAGGRRRVLVVDDAEKLRDCPAANWLATFVSSCAERGQGLVAGGSAAELALGFTGWHVDLRRGRCGALLSPQVPAEGDLIGVVVPRSSLSVRPRVGTAQVNVGDGVVQPVQVPAP